MVEAAAVVVVVTGCCCGSGGGGGGGGGGGLAVVAVAASVVVAVVEVELEWWGEVMWLAPLYPSSVTSILVVEGVPVGRWEGER